MFGGTCTLHGVFGELGCICGPVVCALLILWDTHKGFWGRNDVPLCGSRDAWAVGHV
jgi:hypothetical protein